MNADSIPIAIASNNISVKPPGAIARNSARESKFIIGPMIMAINRAIDIIKDPITKACFTVFLSSLLVIPLNLTPKLEPMTICADATIHKGRFASVIDVM